MIADIDKETSQTELSSFADDTRVKKEINGIIDQFHLQNDLNKVYKWSEQNNMTLNGKKFEHLRYGKKFTATGNYFTGEGKIIKQKSTIKDLGVTLTDDATFKQHITNTVEKA